MKLYKFYIIFAIGVFFVGCSEDDKLTTIVQDTVERGAIVRTISVNPNEFVFDDLSSEWTITMEEQDAENGKLLKSVDVSVVFVDGTPDNGTTTASEAQVTSVPASAFTAGPNGFPRATVSITYGEALSALGLAFDPAVVTGSDQIIVNLKLNLTDGRSFVAADAGATVSGGTFFSAPMTYTANIVCPPKAPAPGDWTIDMHDSYGDGWQTDNAAGGAGITVTLDDGTVFEVGLCSPYAASTFTCTPGDSDGSATITIPSGTESATWNFPGDAYGEISFEIYTPSGNLVAVGGAGTPAGPIAIDYCKD